MSQVGQRERLTQNRIVQLFQQQLNYRYLGDWHDRANNSNIQAKRIWLNLELAKKDQHCLEYVVVHEMVHLLERHHGDRFVALMNKFMPNWKFYKDELNRSPLGSY